MASEKTDIWVYADWVKMDSPLCIGILSAQIGKGRKTFSFEYDKNWLQSEKKRILDPDIEWYSGKQFPKGKENFGLFLDSMPDRWGRTLMKRRAIQNAKVADKPVPNLYDIDFLLGVHDKTRMGALRFKLDPNGQFLDNDASFSIPLWTSIRALQNAAWLAESDDDLAMTNKWLKMLVAPGSSLGGARPKANVAGEKGQLWIAKFPSKNDEINKGAWEFLCYQMAIKAEIQMSTCIIQKVTGNHHTFLTKRFDRINKQRVHFSSAMTMTGHDENVLKDITPSYLELAEFIQFQSTKPKADLKQLWRRIIFNIAVSNTDDHLRNHGFLLDNGGWRLSPAYDINPSVDKNGLSLNIDLEDNSLDFQLAKSVGSYFQLNNQEMDVIIYSVKEVVKNWKTIANRIGIPRKEQVLMEGAFYTF